MLTNWVAIGLSSAALLVSLAQAVWRWQELRQKAQPLVVHPVVIGDPAERELGVRLWRIEVRAYNPSSSTATVVNIGIEWLDHQQSYEGCHSHLESIQPGECMVATELTREVLCRSLSLEDFTGTLALRAYATAFSRDGKQRRVYSSSFDVPAAMFSEDGLPVSQVRRSE
ncbi:hypothetical protein [Amycolatopsis taiwanensis]|uniref:Uncharacterized protein n=1 Tax=Amycolatopsis taiwanensis TaxID=342230 RepID=A0A9W6R484_9PSEU|nr:hypothetical protein [Amycolatopsis taiwanensis]GLY67287.1 hypothetical protein Atai01_39060 [Amycolatopsis taiwanensis]